MVNASPPPSVNPGYDVIEFKQGFGQLVREIDGKDSGQFKPIRRPEPTGESTLKLTFGSRDWWHYKELAELAAHNGNYSQAEAMWLAALIECNEFADDDERLAMTLDNLASLYYSLGRYEQSEMFCKRAFDVVVKAYGGENSKVASCLNNLAGIYYNQKRYDQAEPLCLEVLSIYEKLKGAHHPDVGMAANNLGMLYHAQKKLKFAETYYLQAIRIRTKALGRSSPVVQTLYANYVNLLRAMKRTSEAEAFKLWSEARPSDGADVVIKAV
ncbi:MAG TPA: tetratricopeptide repeat protein [Drouetiella sp.]|jgi:tetratricopeptide (TPR) repeat protein